MSASKSIIILVLTLLSSLPALAKDSLNLTTSQLPDLPAPTANTKSIGFAGMFGGMEDGALIAAGGANFPEALPWKGGQKTWSDQIYYLRDNLWHISSTTLPRPLAYGASVTTPDGIVCIGGNNAQRSSKDVFLLDFDPVTTNIRIVDYPALPHPLSHTTAVLHEDHIYVVGGISQGNSTNYFFRLDLKTKSAWERLPDFPGSPRALHTAVIQEASEAKKIFVIGGRNEKPGKVSETPTNYLSYNLKTNSWTLEDDIRIGQDTIVLMGASAQAKGSMHILVYGGSNEKPFTQLEEYGLSIEKEKNDSIKKKLILERNKLLDEHPGFSKNIIAYNTITKQWFTHQALDQPIPVTALSLHDEEDFIIVSGEVSPGIRTPGILKFRNVEAAHPFGLINYGVLAAYLAVSVLIGLYFSRKQRSTEDYFTGGGRIPWWASGLSVFGTLLSAITFMAIPAKAFITDWSYFMLNMTAILITPVIAYLFIPYFARLNITTAYEFLENRFNYAARALGSLSFILFQLGRIGIVLLLPSLAISIVTAIPVEACILIMGVLCIIYTAFGGIEAVVWTDVLQVVVLMGGSILAVFWILFHTESSFGEMITHASDMNKFNIMNTDFNFTDSTFWVVFIGGLASALVTQGTDQTIVQRYLTSRNVKDSQKTVFTNAFLTLPATIIFFGIGTLLFMFYTEMPGRLSPAISNNDSIFPWYIVKELPTGISGLLIAGIFSAAMSSISSSLNSVSTAFCSDFYKHFSPGISDLRLLRIARLATIVTGIVGVLFALWMANSNIKSLWDEFYRYLGLFTGGLGGMFLLGMLTKRANAAGTLTGFVASGFLIYYISNYTEINFLMYAFFGLVSCYLLGYLFSFVFGSQRPIATKN
ncbi:sodium transporter [Arenibacter aquaticus]|uniref:Sodium transporter n=1 Tax=Arenibacter aquaticus TaxID=2489054 RepID=A0A430K7Z7_9FLAO|nr:sodium/solute symporter [Arenibacter aquaticus]RTE55206.1 sodium transporter [Arenibacter aquaticus]